MAAPRVIAALDIGSSKVCCFVARPDGHGGARVIGIGHQVSRGLRAGAVVDMEAAEESVRAAVDAAERMAGETVKSVYVNLSGGKPGSQIMQAELPLNGRQIGDPELRRVMGGRCRDAALEFTWEAHGQRVEQDLEEILARSRRRGTERRLATTGGPARR